MQRKEPGMENILCGGGDLKHEKEQVHNGGIRKGTCGTKYRI